MTTDASGNASFTAHLPVGGLAGQWITATETDPGGNSSEFCHDVKARTPPAASIGSPTSGGSQQVSLTLTATDTPAEGQAGFTYNIDWGDGTPIRTVPATANNGAGVAVSHTYASSGAYLVDVTAENQDGGISPDATSVAVLGAGGTDTIGVIGSSNPGEVQVTLNGPAQTFSPTDRVFVVGRGADTLQVIGPTTDGPQAVDKTAGTITWVSPVDETITYSALQNVAIQGGSSDTNYFNDPDDMKRLVYGVRLRNLVTEIREGRNGFGNGNPFGDTKGYSGQRGFGHPPWR